MKLLSNIFWSTFGNIYYMFSQFLFLVLIAKLGNVEMMGAFALAFAISSPFIMFFSLRLHFIQVSDAKEKYNFLDYLSVRVISCFLAVLFICILLLCLNISQEQKIITLLIGLAKSFESISEIFYGYSQRKHDMKSVSIGKATKGTISVISFSVCLFIFSNLTSACLALCLSWSFILFFYDIRLSPTLNTNSFLTYVRVYLLESFSYFYGSFSKIFPLIKKAAPLGAISCLASLSTNIPRYFLEKYSGTEELGIYAGIAYIMYANVMFLTSIFQPAIPVLSESAKEGKYEQFKKVFFKLIIFCIFYGITLILFSYYLGEYILLIFYDKSFLQYKNMFVLMMGVVSLNSIGLYLLYTLTALNKFSIQVYMYVFDFMLMSSLSYQLVPQLGISGAVYSNIIVMLYHVIIGGYLVQKEIRRKFQFS